MNSSSTSECGYCKAQEEVDPNELNTSNLSNDMGFGWDDERIKESNVDNETLSNQDWLCVICLENNNFKDKSCIKCFTRKMLQKSDAVNVI